jgi:hypothetical protein
MDANPGNRDFDDNLVNNLRTCVVAHVTCVMRNRPWAQWAARLMGHGPARLQAELGAEGAVARKHGHRHCQVRC